MTILLATEAFAADVPCNRQKLLSQPRPEASCQNVVLQIYSSPDKALRASVLPTDVSLYATPDIESRLTRRPIPWFSSVTVFGLLAAKCGHSIGSK